MTKHTVNYGEQEIHFELEIKNVKNINLNVRPDQSIAVSANGDVPLNVIKEFVKDKGPWIIKNLAYFRKFQHVEKGDKEYISGESFKYLGRQYRLRVRESESDAVKYFRGFIYLYTKNPNDKRVKERLVRDWLREKAEYHFNHSLDRMHGLVKHHNIPWPTLRIREMKSRWGSCSHNDGIIVLNSELIKHPSIVLTMWFSTNWSILSTKITIMSFTPSWRPWCLTGKSASKS